jgi:hypothetical protein
MNLKLIKLLQPPLVIDKLRRPSFLPPLILPGFFGPRPESMPPWMATGRSRPRYFDGRFLAARDLERDQTYLAARQAEYLRAAGAGVIHGLAVEQRDHATVRVAAGAALTASGQAVVLRAQVDLTFGDGATMQKLDRDLGLLRTPRELARRGTGIYALLARPVEYTANPIGFYPASIEERRRPEDGEIVDAVAFTLVPFHDPCVDVEPARQRAALARRLFVERADTGLPVDAVPLAMIQLERGFVRWVDPWLVRREIGDAYDGMGAQRRGMRAIAEAQVHQYHQQMGLIMGAREGVFAATDELSALPPTGAYPLGDLDVIARSDRFFPPAMPLSMHVAPFDELPVIMDEALALPPIDLTADRATLASIPMAIVVGLPRREVETLPPRLRRFRLVPAASNVDLSGDGTGSTERLARLMGRITETAVFGRAAMPIFIRMRRATGDTEDGVLAVERQAVG